MSRSAASNSGFQFAGAAGGAADASSCGGTRTNSCSRPCGSRTAVTMPVIIGGGSPTVGRRAGRSGTSRTGLARYQNESVGNRPVASESQRVGR